MSRQKTACLGPVTRRECLAAGALGLGGFALPDLFRLQALANERGQEVDSDTSVIFV